MEGIAEALGKGEAMSALYPPAEKRLMNADFLSIDYLELRACDDLSLLDRPTRPARLFAAAHLAGVRLIDNIDVPASFTDRTP